jgi:hypothetical protein
MEVAQPLPIDIFPPDSISDKSNSQLALAFPLLE